MLGFILRQRCEVPAPERIKIALDHSGPLLLRQEYGVLLRLLRLLRGVLLHVLVCCKLGGLLRGLLHLHGVHHLVVMMVLQLLLRVDRRLMGKQKGWGGGQVSGELVIRCTFFFYNTLFHLAVHQNNLGSPHGHAPHIIILASTE